MDFDNDPQDRKRRFLRGLNRLLGLDYYNLGNGDILIKNVLTTNSIKFRNNLANFYGLEFTPDEINELIAENISTGEFTEKYCPIIYKERGDFNLNKLIGSSMKEFNGVLAIDLSEMDKSFKYGINGSEWCDVAEGPCSCGAWHH